jgi:hypothetical protein
MPESKVYMLGAGCSKHCGYPLGPEMKDDLERFGQSLDSATSPRLLKAVRDTVALMGGSVDTIDTLVQQLYGGQLDPQIGGVYFRHPRAQTAALAISAAFLAKEKKVRELGFACRLIGVSSNRNLNREEFANLVRRLQEYRDLRRDRPGCELETNALVAHLKERDLRFPI